MILRTLLVGAVLLFPAFANAAFIETEPNNTMAQATPIVRGAAPWADVGVVSLAATGTDVDFFAIQLDENDVITAVTTPLAYPFGDPDTYMALFDSTGYELAYNDDSGDGYGSMLQWAVVPGEAGTYYIAVTGYGDEDFDGLDDYSSMPHYATGSYALTVSVVQLPEPATLLLLAGAGLGMIVRRK